MTPKELKDNITKILEEKKANDITIINVSAQTTVTDYFIIATGKSSTQVKALIENLQDKMEEKQIFALRKDGEREGRWVVLDYGSIIVHIFNDEMHDVYNLEKLWGNASNITRL